MNVIENRLSLKGKAWQMRGYDERLALAISQEFELPEVIGRILVMRGINRDSVDEFLAPSLKHQLPNPSQVIDLDRAVARIVTEIYSCLTLPSITESAVQSAPAAPAAPAAIGILGDYDVDGASSTALAVRYFQALGIRTVTHIPDRQTEGYGPSAAALARLQTQGARLVLTLDCGTTAFDALKSAAAIGLEVIVCDHHISESQLPPCYALVNPNRLDAASHHDQSAFQSLCAVGVTFLLLIGVNRALRERGFFTAARREPNLLDWLDLVALGTVCDVVPLQGLNRAIVAQGLKVMATRQNLGLKTLADLQQLDKNKPLISGAPTAGSLGFQIGPHINAGGRIGKSNLGLRLLTTHDAIEAESIAMELHHLNHERRAMEAEMVRLAEGQILERQSARESAIDPPVYLVHHNDWHHGVVGIVASRLVEKFHRPCLVSGNDDAGLMRGSGRSIKGFDLGAAIIAARQQGLIVTGGGHAMAAGFALKPENNAAFSDFLTDQFHRQITNPETLKPSLNYDSHVDIGGVSLELVQRLAMIAPFGMGNPEPRFMLRAVIIDNCFAMGADKSHLSLSLSHGHGQKLKAVAFFEADSPLGVALRRGVNEGTRFDLIGTLTQNNYNPTQVQFKIDDGRLHRV